MHQIDQLAVGILVRDLVDLLHEADQHERELQVEAFDALGKRLGGRHRGFVLHGNAGAVGCSKNNEIIMINE